MDKQSISFSVIQLGHDSFSTIIENLAFSKIEFLVSNLGGVLNTSYRKNH